MAISTCRTGVLIKLLYVCMKGGKYIAKTLHECGVSHVLLMPVILPSMLREMEWLGIRRIITHAEKSAAYMADAYARVRRSPGVCMAQSVGALNLAAALQDPYLACSPVLALTGRQIANNQDRHAYQEVDHMAPFSVVTKFSAHVPDASELPDLLHQALASGRPTVIDVKTSIDGIAPRAWTP